MPSEGRRKVGERNANWSNKKTVKFIFKTNKLNLSSVLSYIRTIKETYFNIFIFSVPQNSFQLLAIYKLNAENN